MEKVPQIVSERLNALSISVNHPDADMLAAFSERTLAEVERAVVIEHLGACSECREVVALALPIMEPDQQIVRTARPALLTWPALRWGVVVAGIIVVGSFGFLQYQHRREVPATTASKAPENSDNEAKNVAPTASTQAASQDKPPVPSRDESDRVTSSAGAAGTSVMVAAPPSSQRLVRSQPAARALAHGPHVQYQQNANNFQSQTAAPPASPPAPARLTLGRPAGALVYSQAPTASAPSTSPDAEDEIAKLDSGAAPLESQPDMRQLNSRVERSKPIAATAKTTAQAPAAPAGKAVGGSVDAANLAQFVPANPATSITWRVDSGILQRSFDQGNSWQNVDINGTSGNAPLAAFHGEAKEAISDSLKKSAVAPVFRAFASNGSDVWAGASGGLLYHSTDTGWHWTRVVPSSSGARLSGDILSLEFPDPQHGRVVTAASEVWTTTDGGQTWQKQ
jgi:hypothetical protein